MGSAKRIAWAPAALAGIAALFMGPALLGGDVFVPAGLLRYAAPWSSLPNRAPMPAWNPLLYDSVGQFYPWRRFAAETLRTGFLPLWNPYAFCGTPFVANSQSAVFYPPNALYELMPTAVAAGVAALLHLLLAGGFMWALVRRLTGSETAGFVGGCAFMLSGWQVAWLHLPTFLETSCWIPLAVLLTLRVVERPGASRAAALGACVGMMLLAGHLQIAFYGLMAVVLTALAELWRTQRGARLRAAGLFVAALALGAMLASPQVLPALELSRRSHRASTPTPEGYAAYSGYAVGTGSLATLALPTFLGEPSGVLPYRGASKGGAPFNYAEGALYVGVTTFLLAAFGLTRRRRPAEPGATEADSADREGEATERRGAGLFAALAILSLLMAFGAPIDALLYFHVPGFGQSGSPGRSLVLWAFAMSGLAGIGVERLLQRGVSTRAAAGAVLAALAGLAVAFAVGASASASSAEDGSMYLQDAPRQVALVVLAVGAIVGLCIRTQRRSLRALPGVLVAADLLAAGAGLNPTSPPSEVYPETPLITRARELAGHDRVMPVNRGWSFAGPKAVLPPNGAVVFGLRDVQGYDSLFPGQYKQWMNRLAGRDSSPPEVGNMVFARDPLSPLAPLLGVRCVLSRVPITELPDAGEELDGAFLYQLPNWPGRVRMDPPGSLVRVEWIEDGATRVRFRASTPGGRLVLADQRFPGWRLWVDGRERRIEPADGIFRAAAVGAGVHEVRYEYRPQGFRVGLFLGLEALAILSGFGIATLRMRRTGARAAQG